MGRDAELEELRRASGRAGDGHGQIAAIVGEAGVGKSRLVYEVSRSPIIGEAFHNVAFDGGTFESLTARVR